MPEQPMPNPLDLLTRDKLTAHFQKLAASDELAIAGRSGNCYTCPIASYLLAELGLAEEEVKVWPDQIEVPDPDGNEFDMPLSFTTPPELRAFIRLVDSGRKENIPILASTALAYLDIVYGESEQP